MWAASAFFTFRPSTHLLYPSHHSQLQSLIMGCFQLCRKSGDKSQTPCHIPLKCLLLIVPLMITLKKIVREGEYGKKKILPKHKPCRGKAKNRAVPFPSRRERFGLKCLNAVTFCLSQCLFALIFSFEKLWRAALVRWRRNISLKWSMTPCGSGNDRNDLFCFCSATLCSELKNFHSLLGLLAWTAIHIDCILNIA